MSAERPEALLLDVMSTLVYDPFAVEMPAFFEMPFHEMLPLLDPEAWFAFERGELTQPEFLSRFFKDGRAYDQTGFCDAVRSAYRFLPGVEALLGELHGAGVSMYALSNYPTWYRWIEERLELSRFLEWRFVSCHTGVRKPDARAYLGAAEGLGLAPERCLFVDDRGSNCKAAAETGMGAIKFQGAEQLRAALVDAGLL